MKRSRRAAALVAAASFAVGSAWVSVRAAPAVAQGPAGTISLLRVGTTNSMPTLNITKNNESSNLDCLALEALTSYSPGGKLVPDLATSVTQPNDVT